VNIISWLESDSILKISFYKETTAFAKFLLNSTNPDYANVQVCGHSLGGGLSIITGAQAGIVSVVGVSCIFIEISSGTCANGYILPSLFVFLACYCLVRP
jgi:hypothetical protein